MTRWIVLFTHLMGNPVHSVPDAPVFATLAECRAYIRPLNADYYAGKTLWHHICQREDA